MNDIVTTYREFHFRTFVNNEITSEVIPLLADVMNSYKDMTDAQKNAVALWFYETYKKV